MAAILIKGDIKCPLSAGPGDATGLIVNPRTANLCFAARFLLVPSGCWSRCFSPFSTGTSRRPSSWIPTATSRFCFRKPLWGKNNLRQGIRSAHGWTDRFSCQGKSSHNGWPIYIGLTVFHCHGKQTGPSLQIGIDGLRYKRKQKPINDSGQQVS